MRHEVDAVFAADAIARLTGVPGVAAVTAGPGRHQHDHRGQERAARAVAGGAARRRHGDHAQGARLAPGHRPAVADRAARQVAGARSTGRATSRRSSRRPSRRRADGVPGPVFVECPGRPALRRGDGARAGTAPAPGRGEAAGARQRLERWYLERHLDEPVRQARTAPAPAGPRPPAGGPMPGTSAVRRAARALAAPSGRSSSSGRRRCCTRSTRVALRAALETLGVPVYLSGMARGPARRRGIRSSMRHKRREALREADCVVLLGVPDDFRLDYGRHVGARRRSSPPTAASTTCRRTAGPKIGALADPALFLRRARRAGRRPAPRWADWLEALRARDRRARERDRRQAAEPPGVRLEPARPAAARSTRCLDDDAVLVADGGDFVATASYIVRAARAALAGSTPGVVRHARRRRRLRARRQARRAPTRRSGSSTATARSPTAWPSSTPSCATACR